MMGKIADLYYKLTRGKDAPKPNEFGPAKVLKDKCGCGGNCACNSVESLERSAGIQKKVSIEIVKATVDGTATSIPREIVDHMVDEGILTPVKPKAKAKPAVIEGINKKAAENKKAPTKKPVAKSTEKKEAIAKDLADTPAPKKKPTPKKK